MIFYFDIRGGVPVRDHSGTDLESEAEAIVHARVMAAQLAARKRPDDPFTSVRISDLFGRTVHEEMIGPAPSIQLQFSDDVDMSPESANA